MELLGLAQRESRILAVELAEESAGPVGLAAAAHLLVAGEEPLVREWWRWVIQLHRA